MNRLAVFVSCLVLAVCSDSPTGPTGDPLTLGTYSFLYVDASRTFSGEIEVTRIVPGDSAYVRFDVVEQGAAATRFGHPTDAIGGFHLGTELGEDVVPRFFFAPRRYTFDDILGGWRPITTYIVHLSEHAPPDGNFCYFGNNFTAERLATECRVEKH